MSSSNLHHGKLSPFQHHLHYGESLPIVTYTVIIFIYCHLHHGNFVVHHMHTYVLFTITYHNGKFFIYLHLHNRMRCLSTRSYLPCLTECSSLVLWLIDFNMKVFDVTFPSNLLFHPVSYDLSYFTLSLMSWSIHFLSKPFLSQWWSFFALTHQLIH